MCEQSLYKVEYKGMKAFEVTEVLQTDRQSGPTTRPQGDAGKNEQCLTHMQTLVKSYSSTRALLKQVSELIIELYQASIYVHN